MTELQRSSEIGFGDFFGSAFIHYDVRRIADVNEVEIALLHFSVRRIGNKLSVDATNAHGTEWSVPRNIADHQRRARADDAEDIGIVLAVSAEYNGLHLHFVVPTFGEQRTDRTICEAACENFFFRRTTFAFEIASGKFSGSGCFLAVINGEREEVLAFFGFRRGHCGYDDNGFSELDCYGAVSLFGELAGFDGDLFVADLGGNFGWHGSLIAITTEKLQ